MTTDATKTPVHLWVYNHPLEGVSDQIEFFFKLMRQHGYQVSMNRKPRNDALNVVIENFSEATSRALIGYCESSGKRVALIMTEHLDLIGGELFIHGDRLWSDNDYMHPATQVARIKNLMDCVPYLRSILVLGDLPELRGAEKMFPGLPVRTLPFPELPYLDLGSRNPEREIVFSGVITAFRGSVLESVRARFSLEHTTQLLPRKGRDRLNASARIVLNIPQRAGWRWLSLMRVIAALQSGRATVSIGTRDKSRIAECCFQLDEDDWEEKLRGHVDNWRASYADAISRYEGMRQRFAQEYAFPQDLFEYWSVLEGLNARHQPHVLLAQPDERN